MEFQQSLSLALAPFCLSRLRIMLRPDGLLRPPPQHGSTIRGALASAVKGLVCSRRDLRSCSVCPHFDDCAYAYLFETAAPEGAAAAPGIRVISTALRHQLPLARRRIERKRRKQKQ